MPKWLRFEVARASEVYCKIIEDAVTKLHDVGHFAKIDVLKATGYDVFDENEIRWDYVKRIIEEDHDTELVPLASAFFKRHAREEEVVFPWRFIAQGYGKKTAGFAIVSQRNGHFVTQHLRLKRARTSGAIKGADKTLHIGQRALCNEFDRIADMRDDVDNTTMPGRPDRV